MYLIFLFDAIRAVTTFFNLIMIIVAQVTIKNLSTPSYMLV